jgi:hypothetical protein
VSIIPPSPGDRPDGAASGIEPGSQGKAGGREAEPYGSIIKRYRGTKWDANPEVPGGAPRSPFSGLMVGIGALTLVVIAAFTFVAVLGRPTPSAPVESRFIATPQPTPGPDDVLLDAFWTQVNGATFGYHVAITAAVTEGANRINESVALDVFADDFSGTGVVALKALAKPVRVALLSSGGVLYLKLAGEQQWSNALSATELELRMRPFLTLEDPRQLIVSGTAVRDGVTYHRLVSTPLYRPPANRVLPLSIGSLPTGQVGLVLLVTDAGTPVEATITVHVAADPASGSPAVDGTATYTYTKVGEIKPIPSPKL